MYCSFNSFSFDYFKQGPEGFYGKPHYFVFAHHGFFEVLFIFCLGHCPFKLIIPQIARNFGVGIGVNNLLDEDTLCLSQIFD